MICRWSDLYVSLSEKDNLQIDDLTQIGRNTVTKPSN